MAYITNSSEIIVSDRLSTKVFSVFLSVTPRVILLPRANGLANSHVFSVACKLLIAELCIVIYV